MAKRQASTSITVAAINDFTLAAIVGNFDYLAQHLDIDLTGVEIEEPTAHDIQDKEPHAGGLGN